MTKTKPRGERSVTPLAEPSTERALMIQLFPFEEGSLCVEATRDGWEVNLGIRDENGVDCGYETHHVALADFDHDTPIDVPQARELLAIIRKRGLPW